jgi:hypothetical protein
MKIKANQTTNTVKTATQKKAVKLSKEQLENIVGGPETSRGTRTQVGE